MRVKLKRTIAGLLSVLVAFTMLLSGQTSVPVKAEKAEGPVDRVAKIARR